MTKIDRIPCGNSNCFCVEEDGGALLIDTSRTPYRDKILAACKGKNIRLIVLTHGHVDHIQNAAALSKALGAPIAMHRADYALIEDNRNEPMSAHTFLGKIVLAMSNKSFREDRAEAFEPAVYVSDGDTLDSYGVKASVVGLPGHTRGSIGIRLGGSDIFVGDALMNIVYPTKALLYGDRAEMAKSAMKISAFKGAAVHFGHGKSIANREW